MEDDIPCFQRDNLSTDDLLELCRRLQLEPLLKSLKSSKRTYGAKCDSPKPDSSLKCSTGKSNQESWDSGARDLSPRIPASSGTDSQMTENETGTCEILDLASQLQAAALTALKTEVVELSSRLQRTEHDRDVLEKQLKEATDERERSNRRLESIGAAHESRITEMHCVIVELSKKLKAKEETAIAEEHEPEGSVSDLSYQDGSVYNSDIGGAYEAESQTEPLDTKLDQPDRNSLNESQLSYPNLMPPIPALMNESTSNLTRIEMLQEEVLHLRAQVALLQSQLASREEVDNQSQGNGDNPMKQNDQEKMVPAIDFTGMNQVTQLLTKSKLSSEVPVAKMAERVKLRKTSDEEYITGTDIIKTGICTTEVAEHLVSDLCQNVISVPNQDVSQLQMELKQLQRRIEYLKVQNSVLSLTLSESKAHCDQLYLLCGKYESNAVALQQALNYSDRTIEAYDVMLALFESRLDILQNKPDGDKNKVDAETVARHLLDHFERETNIQNTSFGPWQDTNLIYSEKIHAKSKPWSKDDDFRLRSHISKLKGYRASVQNTIVNLESPYFIESEDPKKSNDEIANVSKRMDLETAVLMQELMSMREDMGDYKQRTEKAEFEKKEAEKKLAALQEALIHLQVQLNDSEMLLAMSTSNRDRTSFSEAEHAAGIERELMEALGRESRLKARLQGLAGSLEAATKSSKEKYHQVQSTVEELKQANVNLNQSLERCKRRYEAKLKKLEQQLQEHHSHGKGMDMGGAVNQPVTTVSKKMNRVPETTL